jgi:hypothetical protein
VILNAVPGCIHSGRSRSSFRVTFADRISSHEVGIPAFKVPEFDTSLTRTPRRDHAHSLVVNRPRTRAALRRIQRASLVHAEQTNYPEDIRP